MAKAETMADHLGGLVALAMVPDDRPIPHWMAVQMAGLARLDTLTDSLAIWGIWFVLVSLIVVVFGVWSAVRYPIISTRFGRRR